MRIVVLCGGLSPERNVSISSGTKIATTLRQLGHQVVLADMYLGLEDYTAPLELLFLNPAPLGDAKIDEEEPDLEAVRRSRKLKSDSQFGERVIELCHMADIVFLALHGQCGEDGRVQAAFDLVGIKYTGSGHLGSAIAMDKDLTKRILAPLGILTPAWRSYDGRKDGLDIAKITSETTYPCVVKPDDSGSSIGVSIARDESELIGALLNAIGQSKRIVIEQYIAGREIQVGILGDSALPSIEICPLVGFYDYKNKYQPGAAEEICPSLIPAEAEERVRAAAITVFEALDLSAYSRADFIYDDEGRFWFLEINTLPGMTPTSLVPQEAAAVGIGYAELCQDIIDWSMRKYDDEFYN